MSGSNTASIKWKLLLKHSSPTTSNQNANILRAWSPNIHNIPIRWKPKGPQQFMRKISPPTNNQNINLTRVNPFTQHQPIPARVPIILNNVRNTHSSNNSILPQKLSPVAQPGTSNQNRARNRFVRSPQGSFSNMFRDLFRSSSQSNQNRAGNQFVRLPPGSPNGGLSQYSGFRTLLHSSMWSSRQGSNINRGNSPTPSQTLL